ncbi:MAG: SUF system NifU family Fe-S cluster assembly protein [Ignavibacteriales bacterium]|nr:SUF system NifU family Fe-S cluster assembly protein [Ignavibacteriales bacterium]
MNSDLQTLYQEIILDHNKNPRNFRVMADATQTLEGFNPLCGDRYTIFLKMRGDVVMDITFQGSGCAISKASASVMSTIVKGKRKEEVLDWFMKFRELVTGKLDAHNREEELGKLAAFAGVSEFPARVKCASLAWHTLKGALELSTATVSTE